MNKTVLAVVIAGAIVAAVAQVDRAKSPQAGRSSSSSSTSSTDSIGPQSFEGTWQGVWQSYGVENHTQTGSQSSLSVTLTVRAVGAGKLSGITSTSPWQHQPIQTPRLLPSAPPPPAPPPPPLPTPPPGGKMLNTRTEGRSLVFQVKGPDGKVVDFRLSLQGADAGTLNVTISTHERVYPDFQVKRVW
jgi:hypothetical protein